MKNILKKVFNKTSYPCDDCGLHYIDKATAQACAAWCRKYKSSNVEITSHAIENTNNISQRI